MDFEFGRLASDETEQRLHRTDNGIHIEIDMITSNRIREIFCPFPSFRTRILGPHKRCMENPPKISNSVLQIKLDEGYPQNSFGSLGR